MVRQLPTDQANLETFHHLEKSSAQTSLVDLVCTSPSEMDSPCVL
jgi:hypothetical protein